MHFRLRPTCAVFVLALASACSHSGSSSPGGGTVAPPVTPTVYRLGGTLTGLGMGDAVTLQLNGGADLVLTAPGPFEFPGKLPEGAAYTVTVAQQPAVGSCSVAAASGTMPDGDVLDLVVEFQPPDAQYYAPDAAVPTRMRQLSRLIGGGLVVSGGGLAERKIGGVAAVPSVGPKVWAVSNQGGIQGQSRLLRIDSATGEATSFGTIFGAKSLTGLCYHAGSGFLYAFNNAAKEIIRFPATNDPQALFVASVAALDVQAMALDPATDLLMLFDVAQDQLIRMPRTGGAPFDTLALPPGMQIHGATWDPVGQRFLVWSDADGQLHALTLGPLTLTAIGETGTPRLGGIAWSTAEGRLYGATDNATSVLVDIDTAPVAGAALAESVRCTGAAGILGLARSDGAFRYACGDGWLARLDPTTGAMRRVGTLGPATGIRALFWDAAAQLLYGVEQVAGGADVVHRIDHETGQTTPVLTLSAAGLDIEGATYDALGQRALLVGRGAGFNQLLAVDLSGGAPAGPEVLVGDTGTIQIRGLLFDETIGQLFAVTTVTDRFLRIDPWSGAATDLGVADSGCEALTTP